MSFPRSLLLAALALPLTLPAPLKAQDPRVPVLVELFTSEGCSSCPPADALLARLEHDQPIPTADIIVLEEHVDYWDSLGWRDRFSAPLMTERQRQYSARFHLDDIYTPQMVVAGATQFVGSDAQAAKKAILTASQGKYYVFFITDLHTESNRISARLRLAGGAESRTIPNRNFGFPPNADFYAALVSPHQTTAVSAGENGGRTLQHTGVVRSLHRIGDTAISEKSGLAFSVDTTGLNGPLRLVVFAQAMGNGPILGAAVQDIPAAPGPSKSTAMARP